MIHAVYSTRAMSWGTYSVCLVWMYTAKSHYAVRPFMADRDIWMPGSWSSLSDDSQMIPMALPATVMALLKRVALKTCMVAVIEYTSACG